MQSQQEFYFGLKLHLMELPDVSNVRYLIGKKKETKDTLGINIVYKNQSYWLNLKQDPILNYMTIHCIQKHGSRYHKIEDMKEIDEIQHIVFEYIFDNLSTIIDKSNIKIYRAFKTVYLKMRENKREVLDISYKDNKVNFVTKIKDEKVYLTVTSLYDYTLEKMENSGYSLIHSIDDYTGVYAKSNNPDNIRLTRNIFDMLFNNYFINI